MSVFELREEHKGAFIDYYRHLPDDFLPLDVMEGPDGIPDEEWTRDAWREHLCKTFPRSRIPPKLTLKPGLSFQPPRFLYGWAVKTSVPRALIQRCRPDKPLPYLDYQGYSEVLTGILREEFPQIMEQIGWLTIDCVWVHDKGTFCCLAMADSWITGHRKPTSEQIATLREYFKVGEEGVEALEDNKPMWWIYLMSQEWHYRRRRDDLAEYRPWDVRPKGPR